MKKNAVMTGALLTCALLLAAAATDAFLIVARPLMPWFWWMFP